MVTHYVTLPSRHSQLGIEYLSCLWNVAGCFVCYEYYSLTIMN